MNNTSPNPYAVPATPVEETIEASPEVIAKIEAVIKDANQYLFAILLCLLCTLIGSLIIGPWYFFRLRQWNHLARTQPRLLETDVAHGSIAQRFQAAKTKLLIGVSFGAVTLFFAVSFLAVLLIAMNSQAAQR